MDGYYPSGNTIEAQSHHDATVKDSSEVHAPEEDCSNQEYTAQDLEEIIDRSAEVKPAQYGNRLVKPAVRDDPPDIGFAFGRPGANRQPARQKEQATGQSEAGAAPPVSVREEAASNSQNPANTPPSAQQSIPQEQPSQEGKPSDSILSQTELQAAESVEEPSSVLRRSGKLISIAPDGSSNAQKLVRAKAQEKEKSPARGVSPSSQAERSRLADNGIAFDPMPKREIEGPSTIVLQTGKDQVQERNQCSTISAAVQESVPKASSTTVYKDRQPEDPRTNTVLQNVSHPTNSKRNSLQHISPQRPMRENGYTIDHGEHVLHQRHEPQRAKITKLQKKKHPAPGADPPSSPAKSQRSPTTDNLMSSDQLLNLFMFRTQQEGKQREKELHELQERNAQLEEIAHSYSSMQDTVETSLAQCAAQQVDLKMYHQKVDEIKGKAAKLTKYVQGLKIDGEKSRGEMRRLSEALQELAQAKINLESTVSQERAQFQRVLKEKSRAIIVAETEIDDLHKQLQSQDEDLVNHNELIDYERNRNDELADRLKELTGHSELVVQSLNSSHSDLISRLDNLLKVVNAKAQSHQESQAQAATAVDLQHVKDTLDELKNKEAVSLSDLKDLGSIVEETTNRISACVNEHNSSQIQTNAEVGKAVNNILKELETLAEEMNARENYQATNAELREKTAVIEERLCQKEGELQHSVKRCADLEANNKKFQKDLNQLDQELAVMRSLAQIDPRLPEKLEESQRLLDESQTELTRLQQLNEEQSAQVQNHQDSSSHLEEELNNTKAQKEQAEASVQLITAEKVALENENASNIQSMRAHFVRATETEKADLVKKHTQTMFGLRSEKEAAYGEIAELRRELETLKEVSKSKIEAAERDAAKIREEFDVLQEISKSRVKAIEEEILKLREQLEALEESSRAEIEDNSRVTAQLRSWEARHSDTTQERDFLRRKLQETEGKLQTSEQNLGSSAKECAELKEQLLVARSEKEEAQGKLEFSNKAMTQMQSATARASELESILDSVQKSRTDENIKLAETLESARKDKAKAEQEVDSLKKALSEVQSKLLPTMHSISTNTQTLNKTKTNRENDSDLDTSESDVDEVQDILLSDALSPSRQRKAEESQELPYYGRNVSREEESQELPYGRRLIKVPSARGSQELVHAGTNKVTSIITNDEDAAGLEQQNTTIHDRQSASQQRLGASLLVNDSLIDSSVPWELLQSQHQTFSFDEIRQITSPMGDTSQLFPPTPVQKANRGERRSSKPPTATSERQEIPSGPDSEHSIVRSAHTKQSFQHAQPDNLHHATDTDLQRGSARGKRRSDPDATLVDDDESPIEQESSRNFKKSRLTSQSPSKLSQRSSLPKSILKSQQGASQRKKGIGTAETKDLGPIISPKGSSSRGIGLAGMTGQRRASQRQSSDKWARKFGVPTAPK